MEPLDIQAHLRFGYWLWRHDQRPAARPVFERLVKAAPDRSESLFVQGLLVWHDFKHPQRFKLTHRYFRQSLARNFFSTPQSTVSQGRGASGSRGSR